MIATLIISAILILAGLLSQSPSKKNEFTPQFTSPLDTSFNIINGSADQYFVEISCKTGQPVYAPVNGYCEASEDLFNKCVNIVAANDYTVFISGVGLAQNKLGTSLMVVGNADLIGHTTGESIIVGITKNKQEVALNTITNLFDAK